MQETDLLAALRSLGESGIDCVVVGGLAAVLNGAPTVTFDVDVVFSRDSENLARILKWFAHVDAIFRIQPERRLRPNQSHLAAGRHLNLLTRLGWIDLPGNVGEGLEYPQLVPLSREMDLGDGLRVRVLNLETIISIKEKQASEKDLAVLPTLRSTLKVLRERK
jgi:hypothetical protein